MSIFSWAVGVEVVRVEGLGELQGFTDNHPSASITVHRPEWYPGFSQSGELCRMVFKLPADVTFPVKITVTPSEYTLDCSYPNCEAFDIVINGDSHIGIPGDSDGNGVVDMFDAIAILQYASGGNVSVDIDNADVSDDAKVDIRDALLILQYSAGWGVELK